MMRVFFAQKMTFPRSAVPTWQRAARTGSSSIGQGRDRAATGVSAQGGEIQEPLILGSPMTIPAATAITAMNALKGARVRAQQRERIS